MIPTFLSLFQGKAVNVLPTGITFLIGFIYIYFIILGPSYLIFLSDNHTLFRYNFHKAICTNPNSIMCQVLTNQC